MWLISLLSILFIGAAADINSDIAAYNNTVPYQLPANVLLSASIVIKNNITIIGPSAISCNQSYVDYDNVAIVIQSHGTVIISGISFNGCYTAIRIESGNVIIDNSIFNATSSFDYEMISSPNVPLTIKNSIFYKGHVVSNIATNVQNSSFFGSSYLELSGTTTLQDSLFSSDRVFSNVIIAENLKMVNCTVRNFNSVRASGLLNISDCLFDQSGTVLHFDGNLRVTNSIFRNVSGTPIYSRTNISTTAVISHSSFVNGQSGYEEIGAIYIGQHASASLIGNTFSGNFGTYSGAVYLKAPTFIQNCSFINNGKNANNAGAIFATENVEIDGCTFTGNRAGAVVVFVITTSSSDYLDATISNSIFSGNIRGSGVGSIGGSAVNFLSSGTLTMTNCILQANSNGEFAESGAAVYSSSMSPVSLRNCTLTGNTQEGIIAKALFAVDTVVPDKIRISQGGNPGQYCGVQYGKGNQTNCGCGDSTCYCHAETCDQCSMWSACLVQTTTTTTNHAATLTPLHTTMLILAALFVHILFVHST